MRGREKNFLIKTEKTQTMKQGKKNVGVNDIKSKDSCSAEERQGQGRLADTNRDKTEPV